MNRLLTILVIYPVLLSSTLFVQGQPNSRLVAQYNNFNIRIDGKLNDWPGNNVHRFSTIDNTDTNFCSLQLLWDNYYLYVAIQVVDRYLIALEPSDDPDRIHLNDGIEIYIDPLNDSQTRFDVNDIQLIFDVLGGSTLFRGDRLNETLKHTVPKDTRVARFVYDYRVNYQGSVNDNSNVDGGYLVECKIPWAGLGVFPSRGMVLKADFCINDNDTLLDMRTVPEGAVLNYSSTSILGYADYGFPQHWPTVVLDGTAGFKKQAENIISTYWVILLIILIVSATASFAGFYLWINTLKKIPNRNAQKDEPLVQYISGLSFVSFSKNEVHPYISKAREMVLQKPDDPFRTEDLAGKLATSVRQLQRIFQAELQTSPKVFIITVKLELASQMLCNESLTISEVAYALGFSDPSYFSKVFRKYYGVSPSEHQAMMVPNQS